MTNPEDDSVPDFVANLRHAASFHTSISETCRQLIINRAQFMKYLSGASYPSRNNLRRICDFFGVEEFEMMMPHEQFRGILRLRPGADNVSTNLPGPMRELLLLAQRQQTELSRLVGWYYVHYHSASRPGKILRSLMSIHRWRDYTCYRRIERLSVEGEQLRPEVYKYSGLIIMVGDRLHLVDQETVTASELSHTILYPSYRNRVQLLTGMTMGVSGSDTHHSFASPVLMEALGRGISPRKALRNCGLFDPDSTELSLPTRRYLTHVQDRSRPWQLQVHPI
jgi:transcriptional regulator with XRE-family HTH domain